MSDLQWRMVQIQLSDLKPWERNPRHITEQQAERLLASWKEFGQVETIAVGPGGEVYNGHQRLNVLWAAYGDDYEIEARQASRPLTEVERERLSLLLHAGAMGSWNWDELANWEPDVLFDGGIDAALRDMLKTDIAALDNLLASVEDGPAVEDPGAQVDRAAELREKWETARGQLWEIPSKSVAGKYHRLMCGDTYSEDDRATVTDGVDIDLQLTDPPYGINIVKGTRAPDGGASPLTVGTIRPRRTDTVGGVKHVRGTVGASNMVDATVYRPVEGDDKPFDPRPLLEWSENQIVFGGNYFASKLPNSRCWIVWDKNNTGNFADAELAWTSFDRSVRLYQYTWNGLLREGNRQVEGVRRMHPTQKPAGLFARILQEFSEMDDVIADFFLGSGTTLVACEMIGRMGIGLEIDPAYVAVSLERLVGIGLEPRLVDEKSPAGEGGASGG